MPDEHVRKSSTYHHVYGEWIERENIAQSPVHLVRLDLGLITLREKPETHEMPHSLEIAGHIYELQVPIVLNDFKGDEEEN